LRLIQRSEYSQDYAAGQAFDDDNATRWSAVGKDRSGWLEVDLGKEEKVGRIVIIEASFSRTEEYSVEYKAGEDWKEISRGTKIGEEKVIDFTPVDARCVRLNILKANDTPTIDEFRVLPPVKP
jgi:alpha-L-fucosidase